METYDDNVIIINNYLKEMIAERNTNFNNT